MKTFGMIYESLAIKAEELFGTVFGWIVAGCCCVVNYFIGEKMVFIAVFACVILDAVAGVWSSIRQKKYARSELLRDTCSKLFAYLGALIVVILMGRLVGMEQTVATGIVAAVICACELWSMSASFLIINPKLVFFDIFRYKLVGEIARKLDVSESKVQEAFDKNEDLANIKNESK